jgi:FtsP/CotA-like multicopper oxidase with cupredoxin domain
MLRFTVFAACALTACTQDTAADMSVPDMAMASPEDASTDDLSGVDGDMDNHVPLKLAPDAVPLKVDGGTDYYELHVKEGTAQILPGAPTTIWGFDGKWPGPTIHATMGRPVQMRVFNDLPVAESISIHNHGHNVQSAYDGHPSNNNIAQGAFYDYLYPNRQGGGVDPNFHGAGTYFFHDHEVLLTAPHFYKGISAFYILHPKAGSTEAALNLPSGAQDIPLMIQDRSFFADNSLKWDNNFVSGFQGDVLVVNGTPHPYLNVARRKYRFRVLNASQARRISFGLSQGAMYQIATDGGLLPARLNPARIPLAPAERVDIVVDFAQYQIGDRIQIVNDDPFQPIQPEILEFRVDRNETETAALPVVLDSTFTPYTVPSPSPVRTRDVTFTLDGATSTWQMNGQTYNSSAIEFANSKLGDVETWTLTNTSVIPHPFHQHLIEFQILDICPMANANCGTAPPGTQQGWKDTVLVPAQSKVRIKMQFYYNGPEVPSTVFPGTYVFHCHNLEHEDHAMMLQQSINP